ncbi:MAG TPA: hypothetical protein QF446_08775 [Planctomycetota bacterium]|nr:hypothetical protein [Planctomycetota bacterium]
MAVPADDIVDLSADVPDGNAVLWFHDTQLWPTESYLLASWEALPTDDPTLGDGYASADSFLGGTDDGAAGPPPQPPQGVAARRR